MCLYMELVGILLMCSRKCLLLAESINASPFFGGGGQSTTDVPVGHPKRQCGLPARLKQGFVLAFGAQAYIS